MRKIQTTLYALTLTALLFSCTKEIKTATASQITVTAGEDDASLPCGNGKWVGTYGSDYGSLNADPSTFISGGIAQLKNSPWSYFYSGIALKVPVCHEIVADTVKLEVRLKNPSAEIGSIADYDVSLWIYGTQDTARVIYIGYRAEFCQFGLNNLLSTNIPELLHVYEDWSTVTLEAQHKTLVTSRDGSVIKQMPYRGYQLGRLKKIDVSFKGPGSVDWVKLYSTKSGKLLMSEDFNKDGKSSVVWY